MDEIHEIILKAIDDVRVDIKAVDTKVNSITERLVAVEVKTSRKATFYGLMGGGIPAIALLIYFVVSNYGG